MSPLKFKRLSDESLGNRLASGEAAAFDELYRRYVHRLSAYGSHLLGDADSGDDVAQAALFKAYAALRDGRVPDKMKPWLFRIAHNAAIDLVARRREWPSDNLAESPAVEREPFAGALVEALATLPERQRRVYVLREVHGLRIDETAAELELTAGQVEQALFAARNRLAEQLVFGDRLNCVTVQRLAAGPLDAPERRALKSHLRSCDGCRRTLGVRGRALSLFPSSLVPSTAGFEWLRGLGAGLIGGGAPAAAKVGVVFVSATIAAGVPVAVEQTVHHQARSKAPKHSLAQTAAAAAVVVSAPRSLVSSAVTVQAVALTHTAAPRVRARVRVRVSMHAGSEGSGDQSARKGSSHDGGEHRGSSDPANRVSRANGAGDVSNKDGGHAALAGGSGDGGGDAQAAVEQRGSSGHDGSSGKQASSAHEQGSHKHEGDTTTTTTTATTPTTTTSADSGGTGGSQDGGGSGDGGNGSGQGGGPGDGGGDHHSGTTTTTTTTITTAPPTPIPPELPPPLPSG